MKKILLVLLCAFLLTGCNEKEECVSISGGGFNLKFKTNNETTIEDMNVCIACAPDSYDDLPVLTSDSKEFDGWYYDAEFTSKVEGTSTLDVTPRQILNEDDSDCVMGYSDITLYAKWK